MKKLIIFTIVLFIAEFSFANPIKMRKAKEKALAYVQQKQFGHTLLKLAYSPDGEKEDAPLFVFNVGDKKGFVIVAGNGEKEEIMGYADEGEFDYAALPDNFKAWIDGVAHCARIQGYASVRAAQHPTDVIEPLITTKWGQRVPYNSACPVLSGEQCPTGCTATALAQVMRFHQYPAESTTSIPKYTYKYQNTTITMSALSPTSFDWDNMPDELTEDTPQECIDEVSKLMLYCGQATDMNYTPSGSGAFTYKIPERLPLYFDYPSTMHYVYRQSYDEQGWDELLVGELLKRQPVIYTAYTNLGQGHTFICDGYDGNGLFHINWGWYGVGNGYFRISVLFATEEGLNDNIKNYHLSMSQTALIGLAPSATDDYVFPEETFVAFSRPSLKYGCLYSRQDIANGFEVTMKQSFINSSEEMKKLSHGIGLYNEDGTLVAVSTSSTANLSAGGKKDYEAYRFTIGGNIQSGHYFLKAIYKPSSSDAWRPMGGTDRNYVDVVIDELQATLTSMPKANFVVGQVSKEDDYMHFDFYNHDEDFYGPVYLRKLNTNNTISLVSNDIMSVDANSRRTFELYIDSSKDFDIDNDTYYLSVDEYDTQYFYCNKTDGDELLLDKEIEVLNMGEDSLTIVGNRVMCKFTLSNHTQQPVETPVLFAMVDKMGRMTASYTLDVNLKAEADTVVFLDFPINDYNSQYQVLTHHQKRENCLDEVVTDVFDVAEGAIYWTKEGDVKSILKTSVLQVPEDAVAINLRGAYGSNVTPNANPNTIYLLDKTYPRGLNGRNPISEKPYNCIPASNKVANLFLADGYDYFIPMQLSFMSSISYERKVDEDGWSTICLPFSPTKVTLDGEEVDWKKSEEDSLGVLRVMQVESIEGDSTRLAYVDQMEEFKTYLINTDSLQVGSVVEFSCGKKTLYPTMQQDYSTPIDEKHSLMGTNCLISQGNCYVVENRQFTYHEQEVEVLPFRGSLHMIGDIEHTTLVIGDDGPEAPFFVKGDVNDDGELDITDVMLAISIVMENNSRALYPERADINQNGSVEITDVVLMVDMILTVR